MFYSQNHGTVNIVNKSGLDVPCFLFPAISSKVVGLVVSHFQSFFLAVDDILHCSKPGRCQGLHYDSTYFNTTNNNPLLITYTWLANVILLLLFDILLNFLVNSFWTNKHMLFEWFIDLLINTHKYLLS